MSKKVHVHHRRSDMKMEIPENWNDDQRYAAIQDANEGYFAGRRPSRKQVRENQEIAYLILGIVAISVGVLIHELFFLP